MAEIECISVSFDQEENSWFYCWENTTPIPNWTASDIHTGLRKGLGADARAWRTCQYYLNGLANICKHWEGAEGGGKCGYVASNTSTNPNQPAADVPSGFNNGICDNLGRRQWCDKYEAAHEENLDEWVCAAPNGYMTGLGERAEGQEAPLVRLLKKTEITGYNDDGNGVGKCDCYGMGRGAAGCSISEENKLMALPVVCNYYRPYTMGFGAIQPKPYQEQEDAIATMDDPLPLRLPLSVEFANHRAKFQRCNYWGPEEGFTFQVYDNSIIILKEQLDDTIFDAANRIVACECEDTNADPYNHRTQSSTTTEFITGLVQARDGGLICNGARPECPCYTAKWIHCTNEKMSIGMPVTANQILELRFWVADWESKDFYNSFFELQPNFDDANTSDIYTFTKWNRKASVPTMIGKRLNLCFPIPVQEKEFTRESIFVEEPITFAPAYIETGTTTTSQVHFPTLIRNTDFEGIRVMLVGYPYFDDGAITADCNEDDGGPDFDNAAHIKRSNNILGDSVTVAGQTIKNKKVYALNTTAKPVDAAMRGYQSMFQVPAQSKLSMTNKLIEAVFNGIVKGGEYFSTTTTDSIFGVYVVPPVKLVYNKVNEILVMVDFGDGSWEFRWRRVSSVWCGGIVKQRKYEHEYPSTALNTQPLRINPAATAQLDIQPLNGCLAGNIKSTYSLKNGDPADSRIFYGYSIVTKSNSLFQEYGGSSKGSNIFWYPLGSSNHIGVELNNIDINYIYNWKFKYAELSPSPEKIKELEIKGLSTDPIPLEEYLFDKNDESSIIDRFTVPPNYKLLRPVDSSNKRMRFSTADWSLKVNYEYDTMINSNPDYEVVEKIVAGAGKTDSDIFRNSPYEIGNSGIVQDITTGPVSIMAEFNDPDGRVIATMATRVCVNIVRESCRSIDIFYSYSAEGRQFALEPRSGFCKLPVSESNIAGLYKHVETPNCGDHEHSWDVWIGPMWFPYNICRGYDMYDEFTVCNSCQAGYVGPGGDGVADGLAGGQVVRRYDYRYCGPYKFDAFGDTRGNWVAACDCGCDFWYSDAETSTVVFEGRAKERSIVNLKEYDANAWHHPPFGNEGRELMEKYISDNFISHPYKDRNGGIKVREEWMPMVMDHSSFFMSFNAFDTNFEDRVFISDRAGNDPFYYVNQMNFCLSGNVGEDYSETSPFDELGNPQPVYPKRYRFDELFETHYELNCTYPLPAYPFGTGGITAVIFYFFKIEDVVWAWQEYWKPIEREQEWTVEEATEAANSTVSSGINVTDFVQNMLNNSDVLDFVSSYEYQRYVFSYYKEEHRLVPDEGHHYVEYKAPVIDEYGNMLTDATITIDGYWGRPFKIIYGDRYSSDNYNSGQVTWLDQGGDRATYGSATKDNIYEKADANSSEWLHDKNALFVGYASDSIESADLADKKVLTAIDYLTGAKTYKYYNRGIIVNIPKDKLDFLPKSVKTLEYGGSGLFTEVGNSEDLLQIYTTVTPTYAPGIGEDEPYVYGKYVWDKAASFLYHDATVPLNLYSIKITGTWGTVASFTPGDPSIVYIKPALELSFTYASGYSSPPRAVNSPPEEAEYGQFVAGIGPDLPTYTFGVQFLLGPMEMIKDRIIGFRIGLVGSPEEFEFISIENIELTTAEYVDSKYEIIKTYERKYRASTGDVGDFNLDYPENLRAQTDGYNAGLYYPFKYGGDVSRLDEEPVAFNKTKAISAGKFFPDDVEIGISYDTLHEIERTNQKDLYNYALGKDKSGPTWTYKGTMAPKIGPFLQGLGVNANVDSLTVNSAALPWDMHSKVADFKQYEFWRPGGHRYQWNVDAVVRQKCMLFGGTEDIVTARYIHVDHQGVGTKSGGPETVVDPGNSYYNMRFYVQQAKYDRAMILAGGDPEFSDSLKPGSYNYQGTFNPVGI